MTDEVEEGTTPAGGESSGGRSQTKQPDGSASQGPGPKGAKSKEQSRQQSRAISAKEASRTVGTGRKGQKPGANANRARAQAAGRTGTAGRPAAPGKAGKPSTGRPAPNGTRARPAGKSRPAASTRPPSRQGSRRITPSGRRSPTTLLTWGTVALVLIIVIGLVIWKVAGGGNSTSASDTPLPNSIAHDIATVPASVYNTVGVNSSAAQVTPPTVISGQPPLTYTVNGKTLPGMFYFGAEYCPYCAAERWAMATSLARFGKFTNLQATSSTTADVFPGTQTLSFHTATFASPYLAFKHVESQSNQLAANGTTYKTLETPTAAELNLVKKYDTGKYITALRSSNSAGGSIPFINIGNKMLVSGANYSPAILSGLSRAQIASDLHNPNNPVTQAIITTSNYLSAGICASNGSKPASVCTSKGVTDAAKALKLKL